MLATITNVFFTCKDFFHKIFDSLTHDISF